jgi:hypothetical protein
MKIDLKKKEFFLFKLPWVAARHAFLACLVISLISLLIGVAIFSKSYFNIEAKKTETIKNRIYFDEVAHNQLLKYWQENENRFNEANSKIYPNPFVLTKEKK